MPITATVNESWIIEDTKMDKSALYGFELPAGTWMLSTHIEDTNDWNTYVKSGITKGYSIEGNFAMDLVEAMNRVNLVEPNKGEHEADFMPRCIAYHIDKEGMDPSQSAAICHSKWNAYHNIKNQEELRNQKISFDFDGTLNTRAGKEIAKRKIRNGEIVYIISARNTASGMYSIAGASTNPMQLTPRLKFSSMSMLYTGLSYVILIFCLSSYS